MGVILLAFAFASIALGAAQAQSAQADRVPNHGSVEPAAGTWAACGRTELSALGPESFFLFGWKLGRKGSGADPGGVGLHDSDDGVQVFGSHAGAGCCIASNRVGRCDKWVGPMIDIEEGSLGPFEQDGFILVCGLVQMLD